MFFKMRFAGFRTPKSFMAFVMRRWKILLVLNVFMMAGFITFWGKCNLRTTKAVGQQAAAADMRGQTHLNGSAQETSITHDVLLKRLGSLEDVVYRQLNGNFFIIIEKLHYSQKCPFTEQESYESFVLNRFVQVSWTH